MQADYTYTYQVPYSKDPPYHLRKYLVSYGTFKKCKQ